MPEPFTHPKTGVYCYRKVVPAPLRAVIGRGEYRISLGTKDLAEAKRRYPAVASRLDAELAQAAGGPVVLTPQQIVALAGLWYRRPLVILRGTATRSICFKTRTNAARRAMR